MLEKRGQLAKKAEQCPGAVTILQGLLSPAYPSLLPSHIKAACPSTCHQSSCYSCLLLPFPGPDSFFLPVIPIPICQRYSVYSQGNSHLQLLIQSAERVVGSIIYNMKALLNWLVAVAIYTGCGKAQ